MNTSRITLKQLQYQVDRLNEVTNSPTTYFNIDTHKCNIGHFTISQAYGGVELQRVMNEGGGVSLPLHTGHTTKPKLYGILQAYISGIYMGKDIQGE